MPRFNKGSIQEFKDFLYNSCVHDAKLKHIQYDFGEDSLKMEFFHPDFEMKMELTFYNIETVWTVKGEWPGNRETILSLTVEEDVSHLQNYLLQFSEDTEDSLYLLFQMFSGDELHVVSKEVAVEMIG